MKIIDEPAVTGSDAPASSEQLARQQAIKQIEARRRFKISAPWLPSAWLSSWPSGP